MAKKLYMIVNVSKLGKYPVNDADHRLYVFQSFSQAYTAARNLRRDWCDTRFYTATEPLPNFKIVELNLEGVNDGERNKAELLW